MKKSEGNKDQQLLEKLIQGGRKNLSEWFEKIFDEFCEEQAVEDRTSVETVKEKFYTDLNREIFVFLTDLAV